jgi:hypothetical protein
MAPLPMRRTGFAPRGAGSSPSRRTRISKPEDRDAAGETRKSWLRRHPIAVVFALLCLALALPAGYLYWDYTSHYESTDDAYIAARQFAIAPSGLHLGARQTVTYQ